MEDYIRLLDSLIADYEKTSAHNKYHKGAVLALKEAKDLAIQMINK